MPTGSERLNLLKSLSIFQNTPPEILSDLVPSLSAVTFKAGERIFMKGDYGDSMYIIVEGRVKVHDGELIYNYLERLDVFGEMSALDPEPRSASITALEDTLLYTLNQSALADLMARRSEVGLGIIRILCQRLRDRIQDMSEDFEYLQQFAKVTAAAMAVEAGIYEPESLDDVAQRTDELGNLARIFQRMAREVHAREKLLQRQITQLKIEVDQVTQAQQVAEITETEYFQTLRKRARDLRENRGFSSEGDVN
jgi:CRP/FNR family transcriptional regulator, cyclic AMP receptor protein